MFISFEGIEGSGKTTQSLLLKDYLISKGNSVVMAKEPGGTDLANIIRKELLRDDGIQDPLTEYLLLTAARRDNINKIVKPALKNKHYVICDRFFDSSIVYQGYLKNLDLEIIHKIKEIAVGDIMPDITILIDIDPAIGMERVNNRIEKGNVYDKMELKFHEQIREGYIALWKENKNRIKKIDGMQGSDVVREKILSYFS